MKNFITPSLLYKPEVVLTTQLSLTIKVSKEADVVFKNSFSNFLWSPFWNSVYIYILKSVFQ